MKRNPFTGKEIPPGGSGGLTQLAVLSAGAGRGARHLVPVIRELNESFPRVRLEPTYVDPVPAKAASLAGEAVEQGIHASSMEAHIEEVLTGETSEERVGGLIILNLDRAASIAAALRAAAAAMQGVLGYLLIATPTGELFGIRLALRADEHPLLQKAARFFDGLALVTARSGSSWVVGEHGRPEHRVTEVIYRGWFADHLRANLAKIVADIEPESSPVEITPDGRTTRAAVLTESPSGWKDPMDLAYEVAEDPPMPLVRGEDFAILETGPDGVRIHRVRLRVTDGRLAVFDTTAIDQATVEAISRRTERSTITRLNPAFTTD
jgi:hypothetical protein